MRKKIESKTRVSSFIVMLLFFSTISVIGQTGLEGKVVNASMNNEVIPFGIVALHKNDVLITRTETDLNGNYIFNDLGPGVYIIEASLIGYSVCRTNNVIVREGNRTQIDLAIKKGIITWCGKIIPYKIPLIDFFNTSSGKTFTSKSIRMMAR